MTTEQADMDNLTNDIVARARALRASEQRVQDNRAALDDLILQGMEQDPPLTWVTLQQLTGLSQPTLNAARRRALQRREDRP